MKQFIVLAAILPIMLVLIAQLSLEAGRGLRINAAEDAVRAFCIEASYYNGGGPAQTEALRGKLAGIFRADPREVTVDLAQTDEAHIDWRVSFPVGDIMAGAALMGLSEAENRGLAQMSGTIVIAPPPQNPQPDEDADTDADNEPNTEDG